MQHDSRSHGCSIRESAPVQSPVLRASENGYGEGPEGARGQAMEARELTPPPLPPRPIFTLNRQPQSARAGSLRLSKRSSRPQLLSEATTAVSLADVQTQSRHETASLRSSPASRAVSRNHSFSRFGRIPGNSDSGGDEAGSLRSYAPTLDVRLDGESLLGDVSEDMITPAWEALSAQIECDDPFEAIQLESDVLSLQIQHEFDDIGSTDPDEANEEVILSTWKSKLKHFFILSSSGKPIYSRHGDNPLVSHYIGVAQTIISSFQGTGDQLKSFTAGHVRFVMVAKGSLNLVAISRLVESEGQLRNQLESLYMQILSTLTLPNMEKIFLNRPSTDLSRPLQGTEVLLDGLADGFTRGSPSTLLSALECLRLRQSHRRAINNCLLKVRSKNLLYGLIVAAGRLVSVVRPKKHSLHPGDLHLIFNMLFEARSVRPGEGENWIPLCLPGFNNQGYLYMYVSFFPTSDGISNGSEQPPSHGKDDELAIVLISANRESFYELRKMRDDLVEQLDRDGSMNIIKSALQKGHASCSDVVPGTVIRHFLYKSRGNVQFTMPSFEPHFHGLVAKRKLMSLYDTLHESIHSRTAHLRVLHCVSKEAAALAWETPLFELYCVASKQETRAALAQGANRIVQWVRREEERIFIIGGAVF